MGFEFKISTQWMIFGRYETNYVNIGLPVLIDLELSTTFFKPTVW